MNRVLIGVGNPYRRDDGAGIEVARRLRQEDLASTAVLEHDGEPAGLLDAWNGAETAYVVDAIQGQTAGKIHRVEVGAEGIEIPARGKDSSHALGLGDAVELGRVLDRLPHRLVLVGIEGTDFTVGDGISDEVERAVANLVKQLADELRQGGN